MAFDKLMETLKSEIANEMALREEMMYKKGYALGIADEKAKHQCDCKSEDDDIEALTEIYIEGIEDAFEALSQLLAMSWAERTERYGDTVVSRIIKDFDHLELLDDLFYAAEAEKEEENKTVQIGELLDSTLSDDWKRKILKAIDEGKIEIG